MFLQTLAGNAQACQRYLGEALRMMVGVPDYDKYVAHVRSTHPETSPMSYEEFFRQRQDARYGSGSIRGCC